MRLAAEGRVTCGDMAQTMNHGYHKAPVIICSFCTLTVSVNRKWTALLDLGVGLCCWALVYACTHFLIVPHARTLGRVDSLLS